MTDSIDDEAADRIIDDVEIQPGDTFDDIKDKLSTKHGKWSAKRKSGFASKIINRTIEKQDFESGTITKTYTKLALEVATSVGGPSKSRYKVVRDINGRFLGRAGNIRVVTRRGTAVWAKNINTGRISRIS